MIPRRRKRGPGTVAARTSAVRRSWIPLSACLLTWSAGCGNGNGEVPSPDWPERALDGAAEAAPDGPGMDAVTTCAVPDAAVFPDVQILVGLDGGADCGPTQDGAPYTCVSDVPDPYPPIPSALCSHTPNWCGAALCGNGVRDNCSICSYACTGLTPISEQCDEADLGGQTCQSLGYFGGTLKCNSACFFDVSECEACAPVGPSIISCGPAPIAPLGEAVALVVAASADEVAVAWTWLYDGGVYLARYSPELVLRSHVGPIGYGTPRAMVRSPAGWSVAVFDEVITVAPCGSVIGSVKLGGELATLAGRPDDAPLVVWTEAGSTLTDPPIARAGVLGPSGGSVVAPVSLFASDYSASSAVFAGNHFVVAARTSQAGITLARVEGDGTFGGAVHHPFAATTDRPFLASDGTHTLLLYEDFGGLTAEHYAVPLGDDAAPSSDSIDLGTFAPSGLVSVGSPVALGEQGFGAPLQLLPLADDGTPGAALSIASYPGSAISPSLAAGGSTAVVAWIGNECTGAIHLARVRP
jgi:hypothetical protein